MLLLLFKRKKKKASNKHSDFDMIISQMLQSQFKTELNDSADIDECAYPSAYMLQKTMQIFARDEKERVIFGEFGFYLGRWMYLIDAFDDIEKDVKTKSFNVFVKNFNITKDNMMTEEMIFKCNEILNAALYRMTVAYDLIDRQSFEAICDNIVYKGFASSQKSVVLRQHRRFRGARLA